MLATSAGVLFDGAVLSHAAHTHILMSVGQEGSTVEALTGLGPRGRCAHSLLCELPASAAGSLPSTREVPIDSMLDWIRIDRTARKSTCTPTTNSFTSFTASTTELFIVQVDVDVHLVVQFEAGYNADQLQRT